MYKVQVQKEMQHGHLSLIGNIVRHNYLLFHRQMPYRAQQFLNTLWSIDYLEHFSKSVLNYILCMLLSCIQLVHEEFNENLKHMVRKIEDWQKLLKSEVNEDLLLTNNHKLQHLLLCRTFSKSTLLWDSMIPDNFQFQLFVCVCTCIEIQNF